MKWILRTLGKVRVADQSTSNYTIVNRICNLESFLRSESSLPKCISSQRRLLQGISHQQSHISTRSRDSHKGSLLQFVNLLLSEFQQTNNSLGCQNMAARQSMKILQRTYSTLRKSDEAKLSLAKQFPKSQAIAPRLEQKPSNTAEYVL